jgi:hypothetical protein
MQSVRNTEEMSKMKIKMLALAFGFFLVSGTAYAGPVPGGADTDGDTVEDAFDNCTSLANATQTDTDHNGCGDACTQPILCDMNNSKSVTASDFLIMRANFPSASVPVGTLGDCNDSSSVTATDFLIMRAEFLNQVGPSGITTAQCDPNTCICTPQ